VRRKLFRTADNREQEDLTRREIQGSTPGRARASRYLAGCRGNRTPKGENAGGSNERGKRRISISRMGIRQDPITEGNADLTGRREHKKEKETGEKTQDTSSGHSLDKQDTEESLQKRGEVAPRDPGV